MGEVTIQIYASQNQRGPGKVINNLLAGLNKLHVNYTFNQPPIPGTKKVSLSRHNVMNTHLRDLYIGPNICVLPIDNPMVMGQQYKKFIVNSNWTYDAYNKWLPKEKLAIWAVGIDTDLFSDKSEHEKTNDCLIYLKNRPKEQLEHVKKFLEERGQTYQVIQYGHYKEAQFIKTIENSRYSIVIDNCESQGIALEEMMSCNIPLLVWDVQFWFDRGEALKVHASSVPYWDSRCGEKFYTVDELEETYNIFIENLETYKPREYVIENFTLERGAQSLLNIVNG